MISLVCYFDVWWSEKNSELYKFFFLLHLSNDLFLVHIERWIKTLVKHLQVWESASSRGRSLESGKHWFWFIHLSIHSLSLSLSQSAYMYILCEQILERRILCTVLSISSINSFNKHAINKTCTVHLLIWNLLILAIAIPIPGSYKAEIVFKSEKIFYWIS